MTVARVERCHMAAWDSSFFGRRIGRLDMDRPSSADVEQAVAWAREQALDCLYALVDADAVASVRALERHEFGFMDVRLTLDRPVSPVEGAARSEVVEADPADYEGLRGLARRSHRGTRFTADPRFAAERAADLYATWLDNALHDGDALVLVPRAAGGAGGYLTIHDMHEAEARIGLLAVAPELQGQGVGQALVAEGLRRVAARGASRVSVVTQGGNAAAVRFYERCGFSARRSQLWYHRWWFAS